MGILNSLKKVLDVNFAPDIDLSAHISNITLINYEKGKKISKEGESLKINLAELNEDEKRRLREASVGHFENEERILHVDSEEEASAMESGYNKKHDEILEYFEPFLSDLYYRMLEHGLRLRAVNERKNLRLQEIRDRKRDIAKKTSSKAFYVVNLATAGYFDEDGGLRDLIVDIGFLDDPEYNFQEELDRLVSDRLLCVFVEQEDNPDDITEDVKERLKIFKNQEQIHDWIDIRGIGDECEDTIDEVVENLGSEYIGLDMDRWKDGDRTVVRIYPHTIGSISS